MANKAALGLDFGTESVRAILVDLQGNEVGVATANYKHGQITESLPTTGEKLPHNFALQHPQDWIDQTAEAVKKAVSIAGINPADIVGIGVDFTSCTMLPTKADGTPLCLINDYASNIFAWPKLWKHHGAITQTERINRVAIERNEPWLSRYGNIVGLEWFFPKVLETLECDSDIYNAADVWIEAGDWFVWQLVGASSSFNKKHIPRSTCQAGYKALWNSHSGYPSTDFFKALDPRMANIVTDKMPGKLKPPGEKVGELSERMAKTLGLVPGIPVSSAIIDAHAGVPGVGAADPGILVMVMGTSSCHMLNSTNEVDIPGIAGVVEGGILPGYFGYETGQAAVGDAFAWLRSTLNTDFDKLTLLAEQAGIGSDGVLCMDWFNGCRTPLMDGSLTGAFKGLALHHNPGHIFRSLLESSAFGFNWILDCLTSRDIAINRLIATGGLPHHNPLLMQIYADVSGKSIEVHPSTQGPAVGAAMLGANAAPSSVTGFKNMQETITAMSAQQPPLTRINPIPDNHKQYQPIYKDYRAFANSLR
ncbi:Ribulokinase [Poriferisphaera corsica]|uniref:Ribulokinase n=1 Tax=Poriferisphaera corsica TaxID=2528020 RepID=A0A517YUH6_9BACT|nr:ribulokinase [Poriferisphaera corsica]QDU33866.1 Ribulokinase [Poriferisphaera corsica]